ncbi:YbhB/YbcL family Raf kinase inhibitor-like protein [Actinoplanes sp. NPDC051513]|uniref:YbhB/YbcL family Raf kinase inhibitor-like protein n=1 Tax=Actinoplanes sp. NPDC051513 TaxID=3363908 RepID=UPI003789C859
MLRHGLLSPALLTLVLASGCGGSEPASPTPTTAVTLTVTSTAFTEGGAIPADFTCTGAGNRPPLQWSGASAQAYAIVVNDPDAPGGDYHHWIVVDLPAGTAGVGAAIPGQARQLKNSAGEAGWTAPCPPSGTHHYRFTVYALSAPTRASTVENAFAAIEKTTIAAGTLTGTVAHQAASGR